MKRKTKVLTTKHSIKNEDICSTLIYLTIPDMFVINVTRYKNCVIFKPEKWEPLMGEFKFP